MSTHSSRAAGITGAADEQEGGGTQLSMTPRPAAVSLPTLAEGACDAASTGSEKTEAASDERTNEATGAAAAGLAGSTLQVSSSGGIDDKLAGSSSGIDGKQAGHPPVALCHAVTEDRGCRSSMEDAWTAQDMTWDEGCGAWWVGK
jgi:hypothetical protein